MPGTALLIIDMQNALVSGAHREREVLRNIGAIAARARSAGTPIVYVQHDHATFRPLMKGQPGWRIHPDLAPHAEDIVIEKEASDAFAGTPLEALLRELNVETVMIAGMQTEFCVDATARSALSRDFDVVLLSDCHTTGDAALSAEEIIKHHNATLPLLAHPSRTIRAVASDAVSADDLEDS